eukprot:TRINITY_DN20392_c1_g1_i1.p1 TRINITY_DN20392_c1_g1~~TRINITY_DN20392_c1_g1_i1.p1  ORF type:complete len:391 (+),score=41.46 TRINITY_DN20392_c1_g1_i1:65-1237(+)
MARAAQIVRSQELFSEADIVAETTYAEHMLPGFASKFRFLKPVGLVFCGLAAGCGGSMLTKQGRLRLPVKPLVAQSETIKFTKLPAVLPKFPVPYPVPPNNECGAAICAEGDLCCPGGPGYGYSCGTSNAVCCQGALFDDAGARSQVSVAIVCGEQDVCCENRQGDPYCCASGNICSNDVCVAGAGQCFSGDSSVAVRGRGRVRLAEVRTGDEVLVDNTLGSPQYEAVTQFLHVMDTDANSYVTVGHERGELRLSDNHMVFVASDSSERSDKSAGSLVVGDQLLVASDDDDRSVSASSRVLSVRRSRGADGMYAPMTASGKIVVDGIVASNFALATPSMPVSHGAMYAAFFVSRNLLSIQAVLQEMFLNHISTVSLAIAVGSATARSMSK